MVIFFFMFVTFGPCAVGRCLNICCSSIQCFQCFCTCVCAARVQRERAELEQNFAREISNLVQRLSTEKDQLEAELKLKHDQEVMLVRWVVSSLCLKNTYKNYYREYNLHRKSGGRKSFTLVKVIEIVVLLVLLHTGTLTTVK